MELDVHTADGVQRSGVLQHAEVGKGFYFANVLAHNSTRAVVLCEDRMVICSIFCVMVFDIATAKRLHHIRLPEWYSVTLACNEEYAIACRLHRLGTKVKVMELDLSTGNTEYYKLNVPQHSGGSCFAAMSRDNRFACVTYERDGVEFVVVVWNRETKKVLHYVHPSTSWFGSQFLTFSPNGAYVLVVFGGTCVVCDTETCTLVSKYVLSKDGGPGQYACSDHGKLVAVNDKRWVEIFDIPEMANRPPVLAATP
jgi:hypothetical protein